MKAIFDGQDYLLMLERRTSELLKLRQGRIEAPLREAFQPNNDLGKVVSLELADNDGSDGIELKYLPDGAKNWEAIRRVQVKINSRAYRFVEERGQFGTRYGMGDKIEIVYGFPEER